MNDITFKSVGDNEKQFKTKNVLQLICINYLNIAFHMKYYILNATLFVIIKDCLSSRQDWEVLNYSN